MFCLLRESYLLTTAFNGTFLGTTFATWVVFLSLEVFLPIERRSSGTYRSSIVDLVTPLKEAGACSTIACFVPFKLEYLDPLNVSLYC